MTATELLTAAREGGALRERMEREACRVLPSVEDRNLRQHATVRRLLDAALSVLASAVVVEDDDE